MGEEAHLDEFDGLLRVLQQLFGIVHEEQTAVGEVRLRRDLQQVSNSTDTLKGKLTLASTY